MNENMKVRTISGAVDFIKSRDPDTAITPTAIRRLVWSGTIPHVRAGNKYLITVQSIEDWVSGKGVSAKNNETIGGIRRVEL